MRRNYGPLVILSAVVVFLAFLSACANSGNYNFRVKVIDTRGQPVEQARVELAVNGSFAVLSDVTVSNGYAIIEISRSRRGKVARLEVSAPGYEPYSQYVNLLEGELPTQITLRQATAAAPLAAAGDVAEPAAPSATLTVTPLPANTLAAATETPPPTFTPAFTPTPTAAFTPTPTAMFTATPLPQSQAVFRPLYVYAAPDINEPAVGTLGLEALAVIVGRTANTEWVEIVTPQGKRGWVLPCSVAITGVTDWNAIPVTWQGAVIAYRCSDTIPPLLSSSEQQERP